MDWDKWLNEEGIPTWENDFTTDLVVDVDNIVDGLFKTKEFPNDFKATFESWVSQQQELLLNTIYDNYDKNKITEGNLSYLSNDLNIKDETKYNMQIRYSWLLIELKYQNKEAISYASDFVGKIGRIFLIRNVYRDWYAFDPVGARKRFEEVRSTYHPMCSKQVEADMNSKNNDIKLFLS